MPILLILVFGIIQYGWYMYSQQAGTSAVGDAVRRLSVGDCTTTTNNITTADESKLNSLIRNRLGAGTTQSSISADVSYTKPDGSSADPATVGMQVGGNVEVSVRFQTLDLNFPFLPVPDDGYVTRAVTARVEDLNAGGCS
jgi:Flp pilus assembly protein TadG